MSGALAPEVLTSSSLLLAVMGALYAQTQPAIREALDITIPIHDRAEPCKKVSRAITTYALPLAALGICLALILGSTAITILVTAFRNLGQPIIVPDATFLAVYALIIYFATMSCRTLVLLTRKWNALRNR